MATQLPTLCMLRSTLVLVSLIGAGPAFALSAAEIDEAAKKAADLAKEAAGIDDDPTAGSVPGGGSVPGTEPGCVAGMPSRPSLLGVEADMGAGYDPNVRGTVMALTSNHPLRQELARREQAIEQLERQQAADMKAFPGGGNVNWEWLVRSIQSSLDNDTEMIASEEKNILQVEQALAEPGHSPEGNEANKKTLEERKRRLASYQQDLATNQANLPAAQAGLEKFKSAMASAQAAYDVANRNALAEAARCP